MWCLYITCGFVFCSLRRVMKRFRIHYKLIHYLHVRTCVGTKRSLKKPTTGDSLMSTICHRITIIICIPVVILDDALISISLLMIAIIVLISQSNNGDNDIHKPANQALRNSVFYKNYACIVAWCGYVRASDINIFAKCNYDKRRDDIVRYLVLHGIFIFYTQRDLNTLFISY